MTQYHGGQPRRDRLRAGWIGATTSLPAVADSFSASRLDVEGGSADSTARTAIRNHSVVGQSTCVERAANEMKARESRHRPGERTLVLGKMADGKTCSYRRAVPFTHRTSTNRTQKLAMEEYADELLD